MLLPSARIVLLEFLEVIEVSAVHVAVDRCEVGFEKARVELRNLPIDSLELQLNAVLDIGFRAGSIRTVGAPLSGYGQRLEFLRKHWFGFGAVSATKENLHARIISSSKHPKAITCSCWRVTAPVEWCDTRSSGLRMTSAELVVPIRASP